MRNVPAWTWALVALALLLLYNLVSTPAFFHVEIKEGHLYGNVIDIVNRASPVMLVSFGMTLVIATGGVDLSVGAVMAIAGSLSALLIAKKQSSPATAIAVPLAISTALGSWNGLLVSAVGIQPIVATLILMVSGRGIAQLLSDGQNISFSDPTLAYLSGGHLFGLPFPVTLVAVALAVTALLTRLTALGLFIEATGENEAAARISGIGVRNVKLFAYTFTGFCSGIAGLVVVSFTRTADANNAGMYLELDAILAVVLGGTALTGGRFSLVGSLIGALIIQTLTTTILAKGVPAEYILVVKALAVLAVCLLQSSEFRTRFIRRRAAA